MTKWK